MKHKITNKAQLLASNYHTCFFPNQLTFGTQTGPSTQLIDQTSDLKICDATNGAEELADISSYQTLSEDTNSKKSLISNKAG
jgi:hypothetical protein